MAMNSQLTLKLVERQWNPLDQKMAVNPARRRLTWSVWGVQSALCRPASPRRGGLGEIAPCAIPIYSKCGSCRAEALAPKVVAEVNSIHLFLEGIAVRFGRCVRHPIITLTHCMG